MISFIQAASDHPDTRHTQVVHRNLSHPSLSELLHPVCSHPERFPRLMNGNIIPSTFDVRKNTQEGGVVLTKMRRLWLTRYLAMVPETDVMVFYLGRLYRQLCID